jgi:tRNA threonylcarbamoyladenosine biosynthesis protein TsaB
MILCLETATATCSVALCNNLGVIAKRESNENKSHASLLTLFIEELLKESGIKAKNLEAVAVSKGPGSFTGLRIGVSVAKGIAYAASIPLLGVETLNAMYYGIREFIIEKEIINSNTLFCPMIDARRMEIYYSIFNVNDEKIKEISAEIISENSFSEISITQKIVFFGDGALKCKNIIKRSNIFFVDEYRISASHMQKPAYRLFKEHKYEDVAYFEPFYLKDFITSKPVKNILKKQ